MVELPGIDLEPFFYRAMLSGYANAANPVRPDTIGMLPGSKVLTFENGPFELINCWCTGEAGYSYGSTTIFAKGKPVWVMQFRGRYDEEVIPFLKTALRMDYSIIRSKPTDNRIFAGCRGPQYYSDGHLTYVNVLEPGSTFLRFRGSERIFDHQNCNYRRGYHDYDGLLLSR